MSQTIRRIALFFCFTLSFAVLSNLAQAQTLTVLHNFSFTDGAYPGGKLAMDSAGNLYGTTYEGGLPDGGAYGVVYRLSPSGSGWVYTVLHQFQAPPDGDRPASGVTIGPDGNLYGTTYWGGQNNYGTVYRLEPSCRALSCPWIETILYNFCAVTSCFYGANPGHGPLIFDRAGNIYGTTATGGSPPGPNPRHIPANGTVFELSPSNGGWTEKVLWSFSQVSQGLTPFSGVIFDNAGNLYGTTGYDGEYGNGTAFELSPTASGWTEKTLASINFPPDTITGGSVVMDAQGNLFGTSGCVDGGGVFELTPSNGSWTFTVLHNFNPEDEGPCNTPVLDAAGNVYGASSFTGLNNDGEVYKLTRSNGGWTYTSVSFDGSNGEEPFGSVTLDGAGNIYGTTYLGGSDGAGTVWEITP